MSKRARMTTLAALAGLLVLGTSSAAAGAWDCAANIQYVRRPAAAMGVAFLGSLEKVEIQKESYGSASGRVFYFTFDLQTMYDGGEAETIRVPSPPADCHGLHGFQVGQTYLVSTSADLSEPLGTAGSDNTLAWHVHPNQQVDLLGFEIPASHYDDAVRRPETVDAVLQLLGLDGDLPPTDVEGEASRPGSLPLGVLASMVALASAAFLARPVARRSRRTSNGPGSTGGWQRTPGRATREYRRC